jgi:tRNA nucleotidyltransferase (CCA-adding enzyme)
MAGRDHGEAERNAGGGVPATLDPPDSVLEIAARLEGAGFETWCVGGAVRDALAGHPHSDWDLATAATPEQVMHLFRRRTIPVGVAHGTVGVLDPAGVMHEVTTFRRDIRTDGRHAEVEFGASLDEDLARRDFTVNAIAYSPSRRVLHDPFDGRGDLRRHVLRAVGTPADRMREDRLRALRALRFAARFDFEIDPATWDAIVASAAHLSRLSAERVKEELTKTMVQVARPSRAVALWRDSGALAALIPGLAALDAVTVASIDCLPQPGRSIDGGAPGAARATARADARRLARLAALFLAVAPDDARQALKALRFSNADAEWIASLAAGWQAVGPEIERALRASGGAVTDGAIRQWVAAVGRTRIASLLRIASARWGALRATGAPAPVPQSIAALYRRAVTSAYRDAVNLADLAIDGDDLIRAGIAPGRQIGEILRDLLAAVLADPAQNTRAHLLALAARQVARTGERRDGGIGTAGGAAE